MIINYPLWIVAKRVGAGLGWPTSIRYYYRGSGLMWSGFFPTIAMEEFCSRRLQNALPVTLQTRLGHDGTEMVASVCAGTIAGICIAAPIEYQITQGHVRRQRIYQAIMHSVKRVGLLGCIAPYGQVAMACREIPFTVGLFFLRDRFARIAFDVLPSENGLPTWKRNFIWFIGKFSSSAATAMSIQIFSHPPSVLLAQQQGHDLTMKQAFSKIYHTHGWRGFYAGFIARTTSFTGTALVFSVVMNATGPNKS